jgi:hypothetical protein
MLRSTRWQAGKSISPIIGVGEVLRIQSGALSIFVIIRWFSIRRKFNATEMSGQTINSIPRQGESLGGLRSRQRRFYRKPLVFP